MQKPINALINAVQWLAGTLFLTLFLVNILRITLRYFLGISWLWVPDFSRLLFIWIVFLGTAVLYAREEHLEMDYFINKMKTSLQTKLKVLIDIFLIFFLVILIIKGIEITRVRMRIPFDTWELPTGYAYLAVPACSCLMFVITLVKLVNHFSKRRKT